jgi:hypothetical protein
LADERHVPQTEGVDHAVDDSGDLAIRPVGGLTGGPADPRQVDGDCSNRP